MYELRRLIHEFNTNHLFQKCIYQKYLLFPLNPGNVRGTVETGLF